MRNKEEFRGRRLTVLGGGESGFGAAVLGQSLGMSVWLSDRGHIAERYARELTARGIPFEEGTHSVERILQSDLVVKSPGIPCNAPIILQIKEKGIPVVSEIEFAGWFTDSRMYCITGSNGKTTTTLLTHHIFTKANINAGLAGNVGNSLALQVAEDPKPAYIIELSSFQLDDMYDFRADTAALLNITPDHLDRYDHRIENYAAAKFRIMRNQKATDSLVFWADDSMITRHVAASETTARRLPFGATPASARGAWTDGSDIVFTLGDESTEWRIAASELSLAGRHNMQNAMAAALIAMSAEIAPETITAALRDFPAVEHRLEYAGTVDGARWINDSKATNVNSTWYALDSMTTPVVLILGGTDKGNDYSEIEPLVREKVKAIVAMGVDNSKIISFFSGKTPALADTHSLAEAVEACRGFAAEGDTVLLSPCCASFDLFKNYEQRGELFKMAVKEMEERK